MKSFLHIIALSSTSTTPAAAANITIMIASLQIIQRKIKLSYRIFSSLYNEKNIKNIASILRKCLIPRTKYNKIKKLKMLHFSQKIIK